MTNVREEDSGDFTCVAQNRAGAVEANFTLQVINAKSIMVNDLKVKLSPFRDKL